MNYRHFLFSFSFLFSSLFATTPTAPNVQDESPSMQNEIKHVVVLMLENRSFDNVLGWLYDKNESQISFIPPTSNYPFQGLSEDTLANYTNELRDSTGKLVFSSPPIKGIPSVEGTPYLNSPSFDPNEPIDHVTTQVYNSTNIPGMKGFLQDYATIWPEEDWLEQQKTLTACLETYTDKELPVFYGLARHYTVSDEWFSSVPSDTNPNRAFHASGTSEGQTVDGWYFTESAFYNDTIWNRFEEIAPTISWKIFWQADMIPFMIHGPFTGPNNFRSMKRIPNLDSHYAKIDNFHQLARTGQLPDYSFIEPQLAGLAKIAPGLKWLDHSLIPPFLIGWEGNDMHPPSDVRTAENLLSNIYTSLIANPETWNNTLFIITFDEHGGLFDHVAPPAATPPDQMNQCGFNFDRYGVRVPTIFISAKTAKNGVLRSNFASTPFDHTSVNATILSWKNIDKSLWNLGNRTVVAPTFDTVITTSVPRSDTIICPPDVVLPEIDPSTVVQMGDRFYLHDGQGNYLRETMFCFEKQARAGSITDRQALTFTGGQGPITSGSFALIQSLDPSLEDANLLTTSITNWDCYFAENSHSSGQWWTVKNADLPYLGAPIRYGDRVYLENHTYMNICQFVPARLCKEGGLFGNTLITRGIIEEGSDDRYWFIEKAE